MYYGNDSLSVVPFPGVLGLNDAEIKPPIYGHERGAEEQACRLAREEVVVVRIVIADGRVGI